MKKGRSLLFVKAFRVLMAGLVACASLIPSQSALQVQAKEYHGGESEYDYYYEKVYTMDMDMRGLPGSEDIFQESDDLLNEIYQKIKSNLSSSEFKKLKKSELKWLDEREDYCNSADDYWYARTEETVDRLYWLLSNYDYCFGHGDYTDSEESATVEYNNSHPELAAYAEFLSDNDWILEGMVSPKWVDINSTNIEYYLSGNGVSTN